MIVRGALTGLFLLVLLTANCGANRRRGSNRGELPENLQVRTDQERKGKFFNLFNVVTFENGPCRSTSSISGDNNRNGTCLTSTECSDRGGSIEGNCAAGFGACCVFTIDDSNGGTISQNCTYIQNPGYPSALTATNAISYTVNKCNGDVCTLRLDFESFNIQGPAVTTEVGGGACPDTFTVTTNSGVNNPIICGENGGKHMYVDMGNTASGTATLAFAFTGTANRQYEIKVTQIECNNPGRPTDSGCGQYMVGTTGRIESYNFQPMSMTTTHLAKQTYSVCIRQEEGMGCIEYQVCPDVPKNVFSLTVHDNAIALATMGFVDNSCKEDYISIDGAMSSCACGGNQPIRSRFCGIFLNTQKDSTANAPVCDCSAPFFVHVRTDDTSDGTTTLNTNIAVTSSGFCLEYRQLPC